MSCSTPVVTVVKTNTVTTVKQSPVISTVVSPTTVTPGAVGLQGPPGPQGLTGAPGPQGDKGDAGAGLVILGVLPDAASLPPTGNAGDGYVIGDDLYVWAATAWQNVGPLRGPQGVAGKDGQIRFTGHGSPGVIVGASPNDTYMDLDTGDIYKLS